MESSTSTTTTTALVSTSPSLPRPPSCSPQKQLPHPPSPKQQSSPTTTSPPHTSHRPRKVKPSRAGSWDIFNIFPSSQSSHLTNGTPNPLESRGRTISKRASASSLYGSKKERQSSMGGGSFGGGGGGGNRGGGNGNGAAVAAEASVPGSVVDDVAASMFRSGFSKFGVARSSSLGRIMAALSGSGGNSTTTTTTTTTVSGNGSGGGNYFSTFNSGGGGSVRGSMPGGGFGSSGSVGKVGFFGPQKSSSRKDLTQDLTPTSKGTTPPTTTQSLPPKVEKDDEERNRRHAEVVALLNRQKRLSQRFEDEYELGDVLGDGAFGFVFTATRKSVGDEVAVKFITRQKIPKDLLRPDPVNPSNTIPSEIHFLLHLHHPGIIRYIDHFHEEDHVLLVTELHGTQWDVQLNPVLSPTKNPGLRSINRSVTAAVPAEDRGDCSPLFRLTEAQEKEVRRRTSCDLFECIDAHKRIPEQTCRWIFAQIALTVKYLHANGIVHRDLKDENIVIDENYRIKIVDFGSASPIPYRIDDYFRKFNGTAHFASPEVSSGTPFRGPEAEIWSLGVLLFTIVFGENPFHSREDIIRGDVRYPFRLEPEDGCTESHCVLLIQRLLAYDPYRRARIDEVLEHPWLRCEVDRLRALDEGW